VAAALTPERYTDRTGEAIISTVQEKTLDDYGAFDNRTLRGILVAFGADQTFEIGFHQQLQHRRHMSRR
jgi:hypothetical protein